jgi:serine/threonine-protein kinase RsbW
VSGTSATTTELGAEEVVLIIPCLAEYVGIARLAILGIANRLSFSYDEVEDIRLAVGEACGQSIERAVEFEISSSQRAEHKSLPPLKIICSISGSTLTVEVIDSIPAVVHSGSDKLLAEDGIDYQMLGPVLIEILVDSVTVLETSGGTTTKLTKTAASTS